jgi:hypothetical protein
MKQIIMLIMILGLLINPVLAYNPDLNEQVISEETIISVSEQDIKTFLLPHYSNNFFWNHKNEFTTEVYYNTITKIGDEWFIMYNIFYPTISLIDVYDCLITESLPVNTCIDILIYGEEEFEYKDRYIKPMKYQINQFFKQEFDKIMNYRHQIQLEQVKKTINTQTIILT